MSRFCDCDRCDGAIVLDFEEVIRKKALTDVVVACVSVAVEQGVQPCDCIVRIAENGLFRPLKLRELYKDLPVSASCMRELLKTRSSTSKLSGIIAFANAVSNKTAPENAVDAEKDGV